MKTFNEFAYGCSKPPRSLFEYIGSAFLIMVLFSRSESNQILFLILGISSFLIIALANSFMLFYQINKYGISCSEKHKEFKHSKFGINYPDKKKGMENLDKFQKIF